jgi:membrane-associated phospholipid phosphatase
LNKKSIFIIITVFSILAVFFGIFDMQISKAVYSANSVWAKIFQKYCQIPGMLAGFLGASLLLHLNLKGKSLTSNILKVVFFISAFLFVLAVCIEVQGQKYAIHIDFLLALVISLICLVVVQIWLLRFPDEIIQKYKPIAKLAVLLVIIAGVATVWAFKIPWGRWTYSGMVKVGELALYTPWYLPQGYTGHFSFISGHTSMAFCVLPVVLFFRKNTFQSFAAWALVLLWGFLVSLSRVVIGAHFASDVLFSAGQTFLWFFILRKVLIKI